jgi:O-antigen/teichoic acid export membrane protein
MLTNTRRTIAKNAGVLMVAQLITWGLAVLLTIFMPRYLGPEAIGKFQVASSLWGIMVIIVMFGMDTLLTKEISRAPEHLNELWSTSVFLRIVLYAVGFGFMYAYGHLAGYPQDTLIVLDIIGVANLFVLLASACQASLQGLERMEYISISDVLSKVFITVVSIVLLLIGEGVIAIALVLVGGALIAFLYQLYSLNRIHPLRLKVKLSQSLWMLKASFPFLMINGIRTIYAQLDVVIISLLVSEVVIGWYGAASRLFATFMFIPVVFNAAVFPAMSRMYTTSPEALPRLFRKNFDFLLMFGVPIGLGIFIIANNLVVILFGSEFTESGPVLALMGIVLIMTYQNMLLGQYLISTDRQNIWPWVTGVAMLATIPLDLIFIPWCQANFQNGALGGSISYLVTEAGILIAGILLVPKGSLDRSNAGFALRILFAGGVMVAATWWLRDQFILVPVFVGFVVYGTSILLMKVVPKEDWELLKSLAQGLKGRLLRGKAEPSRIRG